MTKIIERLRALGHLYQWGAYTWMTSSNEYALDNIIRKDSAYYDKPNEVVEHGWITEKKLERLVSTLEAEGGK